MSHDFEITPSIRNIPVSKDTVIEVVPSENTKTIQNSIAENFDKILSLASDIIEIKKMKEQTEAISRKMEEYRKCLLTEAEAYISKKNADTDHMIRKMQVVREFMRDFYQYNHTNLSGDDFSRIITSIVNEMGK